MDSNTSATSGETDIPVDRRVLWVNRRVLQVDKRVLWVGKRVLRVEEEYCKWPGK